MAKVELKQPIIQEIAAQVDGAETVVLVDYRGLTVAQDTELRTAMRDAGITYKVYKNTMMQRAFEGTEFEKLGPALEGPSAIAISKDDATAPARLLAKYAKTMTAIEIKAGIVEGEFYDAEAMKVIAAIPSREELLGRLLGSMKSPIANFARVMNQLAEKGGAPKEEPKEEEPAAAEEPKVEEPAPVAEEPKAEEPAPVAEEPKTEGPAPAVEEPKAEEPAPVAEEPKAEEPAPAVEEPKAEEPAPAAEESKEEKAPAKKTASTAKKTEGTAEEKAPAKKTTSTAKTAASTAKKTTSTAKKAEGAAEEKAPAKKTTSTAKKTASAAKKEADSEA